MDFKIIANNLSKTDIEYREKLNPGYTVVTDKMLQVTDDYYCAVFIIFTGPHTKHHMCRDCGEYYEIATTTTINRIFKSIVK